MWLWDTKKEEWWSKLQKLIHILSSIYICSNISLKKTRLVQNYSFSLWLIQIPVTIRIFSIGRGREMNRSDFNGHIRMKEVGRKEFMENGYWECRKKCCILPYGFWSEHNRYTLTQKSESVYNPQQQRNIKLGSLYFMWKDCKDI